MPLRRRSSNGSETFAKRFVQYGLTLRYSTFFDSDDFSQPLSLDCGRYPVVVQLLHRNSYTLHAMQHKYILRFDGTDRDATA
jgi:hypothetical protein